MTAGYREERVRRQKLSRDVFFGFTLKYADRLPQRDRCYYDGANLLFTITPIPMNGDVSFRLFGGGGCV